MSQLSYWEIRWAIPAAIIEAAAIIGGGHSFRDIEKGLEILVKSPGIEEWARLLALDLLNNPEKVKEILSMSVRPDSKLVRALVRVIYEK